MSELFDIYDEDLNHIGIKPRDEVHRDGDWHQVFHCWVIGKDDDGVTFMVLQKRAPNKKIFPNMLDISAAGHLEAGETVAQGIRELEEELGLTVNLDDLIPVGRRVSTKTYNNLIDCEVANVFLLECNQPLTQYNYQAEEISGLVKLPLDDGLQLFSGEVEQVIAEAVGFEGATVTVTLADFIPSLDNYGFKALILAKQYFDGEKYLLI